MQIYQVTKKYDFRLDRELFYELFYVVIAESAQILTCIMRYILISISIQYQSMYDDLLRKFFQMFYF